MTTVSKWKTLNSTTQFKGRYIQVDSEEVQVSENKQTTFNRVVHPGAVVIVPQKANGNFLMVKQYRHAVRDILIEFPAGTLEVGEAPLLCAQRELAEEAGQAAKIWKKLGSIYPAPGFCSEIQHIFLAQDLYSSVAKPDEDEVFELLELSEDELMMQLKSGNIKDGKSLAALTLLSAVAL